MTRTWIALSLAALAGMMAVTAADPALARSKAKARPACVDQPYQFSWNFLFSTRTPQPNGCAPPVYSGGQYIGQDPDPNIRLQLLRDPATGYPMNYQ
jgi:hypothetical protein